MVVLGVIFKMFGQVFDALCRDGHLNFGRPRIAVFGGEFFDELLLALLGNRHRVLLKG